MKKRVVYVPEENVLYTFRRLKDGIPCQETYRFFGEILENGRYVLFEVHKKYSTTVTLEHFSYRMRKQFVQQKDIKTGQIYRTPSRRTKNNKPASGEKISAEEIQRILFQPGLLESF